MNRILLILCGALALVVSGLLYQLSRNGRYVPFGSGGILDTRTGAVYDPARAVGGDPQVYPPIPGS